MLATLTPLALPPHWRSLASMCAALSGEAALHPVQQEGAVGVVVAGDEVLVDAAPVQVEAGLEQQLHGLARGAMVRIAGAVLVAAARRS